MFDGPANPDFVLLYAPPWFGPTRFSKHHLASYLAGRGGRVLYVEAPLSPLGLRRGRTFLDELRRTRLSPRPVADRLWVRRYFLPLPYHAASRLTSRRIANRVGQRVLAPIIGRDLSRLGLTDPILIAGLPHAVDALPFLERRALVYHCADDYAHARGFPASLPALEADLCRQADLVIATSQTLAGDRMRFNPNTHWVPNGVEVDHFSRPARPAWELVGLPKPLIGFVGGLSEWVDIKLLTKVAQTMSDATLVLVGPVGTDVSSLRQLPNVRLLGPRPYAALPDLLAAMDVALIPFRRDQVTYHADPIKAYEYLAAGVPVVATDMPALHRLAHVVRLASSNESFLAQIAAALVEGREARQAARQAEAARHSWQDRFARVERLMAAVLPPASRLDA